MKPAIGPQERRLAAARAAEERDHLAPLDVEADPVQDARRAVGDAEVVDRQVGGHAGAGGRRPAEEWPRSMTPPRWEANAGLVQAESSAAMVHRSTGGSPQRVLVLLVVLLVVTLVLLGVDIPATAPAPFLLVVFVLVAGIHRRRRRHGALGEVAPEQIRDVEGCMHRGANVTLHRPAGSTPVHGTDTG